MAGLGTRADVAWLAIPLGRSSEPVWTKRVIIRFMTHRANELERERCEERCAASRLDNLAG